jgi:hypothetical protein
VDKVSIVIVNIGHKYVKVPEWYEEQWDFQTMKREWNNEDRIRTFWSLDHV